uniref:50S ribosomal protein L28 n=1 Tax=Ascaris lumbricoides TaxID=6252 RepID=A0A0M3IXP4_ASCLU
RAKRIFKTRISIPSGGLNRTIASTVSSNPSIAKLRTLLNRKYRKR